MGGLIFFLAIMAIVVAVGFIGMRQEKRRRAGLAAAAGELGFAFSHADDADLLAQLAGFPLAEGGRKRSAFNILRGHAEGTDITIFDYRYVVGRGKNRRTVIQSVLLLQWPQAPLPVFVLEPEHLFHKLAELFGYNDIDFDTHPEFSRRHRLKGADEAAVRALFTDEVLAFYESKPDLCTETREDAMIVYRQRRRVPPEGIGAFYQEGWTAYALLRRLPAGGGLTADAAAALPGEESS